MDDLFSGEKRSEQVTQEAVAMETKQRRNRGSRGSVILSYQHSHCVAFLVSKDSV